jgi:VWFA-related protein
MESRQESWLIPLLLAGVPTCLAQPSAQMTAPATPTFRGSVNLVLVPVVVKNGQGQAIGNLRQQDFQLFDDGKAQVITEFSIETTEALTRDAPESVNSAKGGNPTRGLAESAPLQAPTQELVAWLFDDVHLSPADLERARAAAVRALKDQPARTRIGIYTVSGRVIEDFTDEREKLLQAVSRIRPIIGSANFECPEISYYQADRIVSRNDGRAVLAGAVDYLIKCDPPSRNHVQDDVMRAMLVVQSVAGQALSRGRLTALANLSLIKDLLRKMSALPGDRTIVLVSPGFFLTGDLRAAQMDLIDLALRANITISSLNTVGLRTMVRGGTADATGFLMAYMPAEQEFERQRRFADEGVMQELAEGTGGMFFHNDNDLLAGLKKVTSRPEYVYVLGFSPENSKPGMLHQLKVSLRRKGGLQVQARHAYSLAAVEPDPSVQANEGLRRAAEAIFSREEVRELPVELSTHFVRSEDSKVHLSISARIDGKGLHYQKVDGVNNGSVLVMGAVYDSNGKYVAGRQRTVTLKLTDETLYAAGEAPTTIDLNFDVASGSYLVRLVVVNLPQGAMSALTSEIVIP